MSNQAVSDITGKNKDILFHSVNINYDEFKSGRLAWDYEKIVDTLAFPWMIQNCSRSLRGQHSAD